MIFPTKVNGIPCQVQVTYYRPETPAQLLSRPENCYPSEPEELEFEILDRRGRLAKWLDKYITPDVFNRIAEEHHIMVQGEAYNH